MIDPIIKCPSCQTFIKLTESLAAPLLEATHKAHKQQLEDMNRVIAVREKSILEQLEALKKRETSVDLTVADKVREATRAIAAEEFRRAKIALSEDLEQQQKNILELNNILKEKDQKLSEAQKAQADVMRKQRELDDAKREFELTVEKQVHEKLGAVREKAKQEAEDQLKLKVLEREQTISALHKKIEDLNKRVEQGSQQLQGEVQELNLENLLRAKFPFDKILPVAKGEYGGDIVQQVSNALGQSCGTILWESKRTKNWSDSWLAKLRDDQRAAKAEICVIVSSVLPDDIENFELIEGVWVTTSRTSLPLAVVLRQGLIDLAGARKSSEGQQTKMEIVYQYLVGPGFKLRVQAIVEAFSSMKQDLDSEKKAIMKQWAKREIQIDRVMQATVGMYGDLQGIAGKSLQEIEGLSLAVLDEPPFEGK